MKLFRKLDDLPEHFRGGAVTIGNFDGVHRGHATLVDRLKQLASKFDGAAIVFTFDPHPVRILRPDQAPPPLTWTNRKADLLAELGVDAVVAYPTTRELLELEYDEFFTRLMVDKLAARAMVEGPNFFFGRGRKGTIDSLGQLCNIHEIDLHILDPLKDADEYISSSRIRGLIRVGDVDLARQFLTHPYRIRGMVTHGAARGASLGFPTANLDAIDTLIPAPGVYAGRTYIDSRPHWSAVHIGPNPTFAETVPKVESHVLDFDGSIYGHPVELDFISRLRDIRPFESVTELTARLEKDVAATRRTARNFSA